MAHTITEILERLERVKATGKNKWQARCPSHEDSNPSLSVAIGDNGKVLLHCHAACSYKDILKALGLNGKATRTVRPTHTAKSTQRKIVETYPYMDESGKLLFEVVRTDPKSFPQRRPDGDKWVWNLDGVRRVLYKLPELLAAERETMIFIAEGEKDCDNLAALRLVSTTNPGGAGKWKSEYNRFLKDRDVVILPDLDEPGAKHRDRVVRELCGTAASIKVVELPDMPTGGKDVSDWLDAGHDKGELLELVQQAEPYRPTKPATPTEAASDFHLTDAGNAERLAARYGDRLRFWWTGGKNVGRWLAFDGRRWNTAKGTEVARKLALKTVRSVHEDADKDMSLQEREELAKFAFRSERQNNLLAMLSAAQAVDPFPAYADDFDKDLMLFNCRNGTIDLKTGELGPHNPADMITKVCPVEYDPDAALDMWDEFLRTATDDNAELMGFLQKAIGYSLTGRTDEEKLFFVHGPQATGKSTFLEAIKAAFGDYSHTTSFETFLRRDHMGGRVRNDIAALHGARLVVSNEVDDGKRLAEGIVKTLTGGDTVRANRLYEETFEFAPQFKLFLAANHAPKVDYRDGAIWRRILRIPFEHTIHEDRQDPKIKATLGNPRLSGAAILAWAVQGCMKWQDEGLQVPDLVRAATEAYRADNDPLKDFVEDCCILTPAAIVPVVELRKAYETWCQENGQKFTISARNFNDRLRELGCEAGPTRYADKVCKCWHGIGLGRTDEDLPI